MVKLIIQDRSVGRWTVPAVVFHPEDQALSVNIMAIIGNSVTTSDAGKHKLLM